MSTHQTRRMSAFAFGHCASLFLFMFSASPALSDCQPSFIELPFEGPSAGVGTNNGTGAGSAQEAAISAAAGFMGLWAAEQMMEFTTQEGDELCELENPPPAHMCKFGGKTLIGPYGIGFSPTASGEASSDPQMWNLSCAGMATLLSLNPSEVCGAGKTYAPETQNYWALGDVSATYKIIVSCIPWWTQPPR